MGRCRTKCINETSFAHTEPAAKSGAGSPEHPGSVLWEKEKKTKKAVHCEFTLITGLLWDFTVPARC